MLVVMKRLATEEQVKNVCHRITAMGLQAHCLPGENRTAIGVTGNSSPLQAELFENIEGVDRAIPVTKPYKLVSRELVGTDTVIKIPKPDGSEVGIGGKKLVVMAGPCAVEEDDRTSIIAKNVMDAGAEILRGGAYKPRTSPYSFQGLGLEGLKYLANAREKTGLPVITEAVDVACVDELEEYADIIQIGARNMQSFSLLKRVGKSRLPVMLKRGMSATVDEFLQAAEYIMSEGNYNVILCERGVRTFAHHTRNTLDLSAVPVLKRMTHLPVIVDPSHATGSRKDVAPMAKAAVACGADGLMIEVHNEPDKALSDGPQSLLPEDFARLINELKPIAEAVGRSI
jgi:3-deoxy-7-phosphoheptulonate synthase